MCWDLNKLFMQEGISLSYYILKRNEPLFFSCSSSGINSFGIFSLWSNSILIGCLPCVLRLCTLHLPIVQHLPYGVTLPCLFLTLVAEAVICSPNCSLLLPCAQTHYSTSSAVRCDLLTQSGQCNVGKVMHATKLAMQSPSFLLSNFWLIGRLCRQRKMWKELGTQNDYLEQNICSLTNLNWTEMKCEKSTFFIALSHWELGVCMCVTTVTPP